MAIFLIFWHLIHWSVTLKDCILINNESLVAIIIFLFTCYLVEVSLEDEDADTLPTANEADINSAINGILEAAQEGPAEQITHEEASDCPPVTRGRSKRSLIWRHYDRLDSLSAARCRICMKKIQCSEGGSTSNLHRHMSKRHPGVFSQLMAEGQHPAQSNSSKHTNGDTSTPPETVGAREKQRQFSGNVL